MLKQNDIAMVVMVVIITSIASLLLVDTLIKSPEERSETVPQVTEISTEWPEVNQDIFNEEAINPTLEIEIGNSTSEQPFQDIDSDL